MYIIMFDTPNYSTTIRDMNLLTLVVWSRLKIMVCSPGGDVAVWSPNASRGTFTTPYN